jgi:hypothetical protein
LTWFVLQKEGEEGKGGEVQRTFWSWLKFRGREERQRERKINEPEKRGPVSEVDKILKLKETTSNTGGITEDKGNIFSVHDQGLRKNESSRTDDQL